MFFDYKKAVDNLLEASSLDAVDRIEESEGLTLVLYDASKNEDYSDDHLTQVGEIIKNLQLGKHVTKIEVLVSSGVISELRATRVMSYFDLQEISDQLTGL